MGSVMETSIQQENDQSGIFITDTSRLPSITKRDDRNLSMDLKNVNISSMQNSGKFMKNL